MANKKRNIKDYTITLHFKERYKERFGKKIDKKELNGFSYWKNSDDNNNVLYVKGDMVIAVDENTQTLITCYKREKKAKEKKQRKELFKKFSDEVDKIALKYKKELYQDFLDITNDHREVLNKNKNIGKTTQPKDVKMKMYEIDEAIQEIGDCYAIMKSNSYKIDEIIEKINEVV